MKPYQHIKRIRTMLEGLHFTLQHQEIYLLTLTQICDRLKNLPLKFRMVITTQKIIDNIIDSLVGLTCHKELVVTLLQMLIETEDQQAGKSILDKSLPVLEMIVSLGCEQIVTLAVLGFASQTGRWQWHILDEGHLTHLSQICRTSARSKSNKLANELLCIFSSHKNNRGELPI